MRILGLDMGSKTIGVAMSDPLGWTAQGITTIRRTKKENDLEEIQKICKEYGVETIVVGLPKNMNGTIGEAGEKALEFSELLKEQTGLPIEMWDERLTTVAAHRAMLEADLSRNKRKKIVDKIAESSKVEDSNGTVLRENQPIIEKINPNHEVPQQQSGDITAKTNPIVAITFLSFFGSLLLTCSFELVLLSVCGSTLVTSACIF